MLPEEIKGFITKFSKLPSIGIRQATRLAFKLISGGKNEIEELSKTIWNLANIKICSRCFFVHRNADMICDICRNPQRNRRLIAIVEKDTDLISLEKAGVFKGTYLILGDLSKGGVLQTAQKLKLNNLKNLIKKEMGVAEEIILALNPTTFGDLNTNILMKELGDAAKKITRLGRGIPTGGEIEFADDETLKSALERRS